MMASMSTGGPGDPHTQMNTYRSYVTMLADPGAKDEIKLKAAQELSENFEVILSSPQYPQFLDHSLKIFLKILLEGEPHFIAEYNIQQVRKLILEMIHRLPISETLRPYVKSILVLMLKLMEIENEENVLVCLKIFMELHKQYRPAYSTEVDIHKFLQWVKGIYSDLPNHLPKIFEPKPTIRVKDLSEVNIEQLLQETYTITPIHTEKKLLDGSVVTYNLIPRSVLSLKVIQELPIIVVLMYQLYKQNVHQEVSNFIPLIMETITLQPAATHRQSASFNKEVFVDFMGAQIKTLAFLAYIIRIYQDTIANHANLMVKGIIGLLTLCPPEVAHLRKELVIATRHILATDLRLKFVPYMERLFDEDVLLGGGWTVHESLRPLAYSTLADLVHHVRQHLPLTDLAIAAHLFSKNVHDESLPTSIQTMSCKLLLNLVDCIRQRSESEAAPGAGAQPQGRQLLMRILEVFVLKFKTISKLQLPALMNKCKQMTPTNGGNGTTPNTPTTPAPSTTDIKVEEEKPAPDFLDSLSKPEEKSKIGFPNSQMNNLNVGDYRTLVKTLVCGVKTITWGCASCKTTTNAEGTASSTIAGQKQFTARETLVFIRLVRWGLQSLDIYTLAAPRAPALPPAQPHVRSKEEKEVLEHFSGVFSMMNPQTFQEIFTATISHMVERINKNMTLQIIANTFLSNPATSPIFATVLVEYLLKRMEEMGTNIERSNLYLRLFKLVFGSVSLFPTENEQMLRPHLHSIVNKAMDYAMTAKEPYNYFLLLRALFRSIGGGSHDLLYQEFLPLLPNLLEGLNRLQSGLHKQHMKDLFVELCLTVPVRLSSLLPYLPMLMDPLVSALNGSHTLISQGLRTLELCVDNLQPDFLYEHIQPVRADLMQALWRTLQNNEVARIAFRVLGKFGGGNRKMMIEPQRLEYRETDAPPPAVQAYFQDQPKPIDFEVDKVIDTAFAALKSSTTDPFYRRQCWEVLRCYLAASLNLDDAKPTLQKLFNHPAFLDGKIQSQNGPYYKCTNSIVRNTHRTALTGMFVAAAIKELRHHVLPTMVSLVRHYTLVAIAQEAGPFAGTTHPREGLDALVLVDAIAVVMGHEEKELCKPGHLALVLMIETAATVLGSKERACRLPLMEYLAERMSALCYERAWYAKLGGCIAVKFMFEKMAPEWVYKHVFTFLKAVLFVMMDLTGEVSSGAIDMATMNLERLVRVCVCAAGGGAGEPDGDVAAARARALHDVLQELVLQVTSPHLLVRQQAMKSLELIAELQGKTVTEVMDPHREVLADIIPPKKHLLRHQPANAQMGLMDGTTFCTTLKPRLFTIDLNINEHKVFFRELLSLCEAEDAVLGKLPCYKGVNLVPLRASALKALAACHYIQEKHCREKIFQVLYKSLEKNDQELQQAGFECMQKFLSGFQIDMEMVHPVMRPLLLTLGDHRNLSVNGAKRLSYLTQLFPSTFSEKLCEQLLQLLKKLLDYSIQTNRGGNFLQSVSKNMENEQKIIILIGIFHQIPAASPRFIDVLCRLIFHTEKSLMIEAGSPFREPLVKFLLRYPKETLDLVMSDNNIKDQQWSRFLIYLVKHPEAGSAYREALQTSKKPRLMQLLAANTGVATSTIPQADKAEMQFQAVRVISLLIKYDEQWMSTQHDLIELLKRIWCSDQYHETHKKVENVDCTHWKEPKLIVKILLHYFCHHPSNIDLLFQLLRALCDRFIPDFQFLRDFLENTVAQKYTLEWKRSAFFRFVEHFASDSMSQELKAKVLQMILIPCFAVSFEKGQKIVGGPPAPYQDNPDNVVSVFINNVIDPENPFACSDAVRISLLQFACLLLEQASAHIHDANNKKQGNKLRRLMTFAWPCLLGKNYVDPATRYHGHLLLSHIIAKFAIHKRIVLQVFHSLLKAHAVEARSVVRQALEILTPAMPQRMEDGNTMLTHWTKKIIVEDGHSVQQLFHILQLVVRHYKVYYPVRHALVVHMVGAMQRLGFSATASLEHRRLAVDLAEVALKWDLQRIRDHTHDDVVATSPSGAVKRVSSEDMAGEARKALNTGWASPQASTRPEPDAAKPLDRQHVDVVVNLLLRLACQVNEGSVAAGAAGGSPGEQLSRRCVQLLKAALKPDVWPHHCEPKLAWLDKVFATADSNAAACANACTALELLAFLLGVLRREQTLAALKPLQRGLAACVASTNAKIVRLTHNLLAKLTALFPTEPTGAAQASKYEELETLYACVSKYAFEGLATYEKSAAGGGAGALLGPLMMLKACCASSPAYIDRLLLPLMRVLQRMARDHVQPNPDASTSDLLILALDLLKARVSVMPGDTRKTFIGSVLVGLIEKTTDAKVMKAITRMVEEWVKWRPPAAGTSTAGGAAPSLREKSILLVKLMQYVEKRFPDDLDLNAHFLELINYVYRDDQLKMTELSMKLEPAFLAGLRCPQPHIRAKFFEVYDQSVRRRIFDRLLYIICSQNWEHIGQHFWIKQCLELLLVTCVSSTQIRLSNSKYLLPSITAVINWADSEERKSFVILSAVKEESSDGYGDSSLDPDKEDVLDMDLDSSSNQKEDVIKNAPNRQRSLNQIVAKQSEFLELARRVRTEQLVVACAQLCHMDDALAHHTWLRLFPALWTSLDSSQLPTIMNEIVPFIISGIHVIQRDQPLSALNTFIEALARCNPPVSIKPPMMKYLGKTHNLWHRMTLNLEQMAIDQASGRVPKEQLEIYDYDVESTTPTEILDSLSDMYELLQEEDMWSGLWQKHARYRETNLAIALEQQGFYELAQGAYDTAMSKLKQEYAANPSSYNMHKECTLWTQHWIKCAKELNQWDSLLELGLTRSVRDPFLILESSWRNPNWPTMKDALAEVEYNCPKELAWLVNLYRGYLCICAGGEQQLSGVERHAEAAAAQCLREWRRLPRVVSHAHLPLLRAAQQLMELSEAAQIHTVSAPTLHYTTLHYLCICAGGEQQLSGVERHAEAAAAQCLREWRRLPRVVSHAHLPLLRAAQQLMELSEAAQIHTVSAPTLHYTTLHYLCICAGGEQQLSGVERHAEAAAAQCLREWRRLPRVVSHAHLPLLRAAQQLMELSEAAQIHTVSAPTLHYTTLHYLCICAGGEQQLSGVERHAEAAAAQCLREWRRLPRVVSHAHLPLLRAAQQLMELSEAAQIHTVSAPTLHYTTLHYLCICAGGEQQLSGVERHAEAAAAQCLREWRRLPRVVSHAHLPLLRAAQQLMELSEAAQIHTVSAPTLHYTTLHYLCICAGGEQQLSGVERHAEAAAAQCLREWRRLPRVVSHAHLPLLRAAQQLMELSEAAQIHTVSAPTLHYTTLHYLCICAGGEQQLSGVERHAEAAAAQCLREWRRLPRVVSHAHLPLLRAAQQLMELSEAAQIHTVSAPTLHYTTLHYLCICAGGEQQLSGVERHAEAAAAQCLREWRRLPRVVSHAHLPLLRAAQQLMELSEAAQIHTVSAPTLHYTTLHYLCICAGGEQQLSGVERHAEAAAAQCLREWRRLPRVVSHAHLPLLRAAQQLMELSEAAQIHTVSAPTLHYTTLHYLCICAGGEQQLSGVERHAEAAAAQCLREWRRLPRVVSHAHLPLLRAAQQLMELSEAAQIHTVSAPTLHYTTLHYLCICAGGEQQLSGVERHAEAAAAQCLREWRRLPRVVSHAHLPLLRAAQQLMELSEAAQIHTVSAPTLHYTTLHYLCICAGGEQQLSGVERHAEAAAAQCLREWRRLPRVVSHAHLPLLRAAQQLMELSEAAQIHTVSAPTLHYTTLHYLCICAGGEQQLSGVERHAEAAAAQCLREWRRLPRVVSHAHLPLLRAAQQLMELSEAAQIHTGLLHSRPTSLHDMKAIVKTWRNRLPVVADPLSHWGAIFTWRQHHYQFIASHYDSQTDHASNHSMLGVHASAQAIIHFAKIARKHSLSGVCLDSLHRIYTIPSVPIVDCFQKIRQQVKCHIQMSWTEGKDELQEGLDMIESTNFKYFTKEMTAEFYAFKGLLLAQLGRSEDANKAFAAAVQLHDTLVKAWALWGDYLEQIFIRDPRQIAVGVSAMTCFLHACRHQNESKSRKYCAKVLWMLSYDDEKNSLADALDKYSVGVPPVQWLPWIPQLLACLVQYDGNVILNLLSHVGRLYPQAVYFPIRTLYLTLKIEQRERHKSAETLAAHLPHQPAAATPSRTAGEGASSASGGPTGSETGPIKATLPMWRCSKIMQLQREIHPTVLSSLEGIVDQMVWFRENWYEEVLRQLRAGLAKCHVVAFHHRGTVADATVTPHTLNFIKKVVSTFGIGIGITASESLARRAQATVQDPVFQKMKTQFTSDFDFTQPNAMKLQNLIQKLRKWVKILETKTKVLPKSFLIEEKCRFLSNFSLKTAEVELPGEFLLPKHTHYHVRIARFMPRVEIVQKHNTSARRLYIRGHNGKIYPYLVVNDSGLGDARREERVLQLLRMLNHYLGKQKETSRRFLHFTVPRVVSVSPQMRLVEDNPSSISLLDIYRTECANRGVEYDAPVARYYERLAAVQARGSQASHQVLRDILREVQSTMVPKGMVREWAAATFAAPTDYWTFRKMLTLQLSLAGFAEYVLHLTRLNPDMMYVHQDSGLLNVSYFKFDVDDTTGELDGNRPVPFRLTPNISELLTNIGITGPLTASAISVARCLVTPNFKIQSILRTILRDEMVTGYRKRLEDKSGLASAGTSTDNKPMEMDNETIINMVTKAVTAITSRLTYLAQFDGPDSKVATLVTAANSHDNLCRMDPAWHPWL